MTPQEQEKQGVAVMESLAGIGIIAGVGAKTANIAKLAIAKKLEASGIDRIKIWNDTGWYKGPEGAWKFEVDDFFSKSNIKAFKENVTKKYEKETDVVFDASILKSWQEQLKLKPEEAIQKYVDIFKRKPKTEAVELGNRFNAAELSEMYSARAESKIPISGPFSQAVEHKEAFEAYPKLKQLHTMVLDNMTTSGSLNRSGLSVAKWQTGDTAELHKTFLHEAQHWVQEMEKGFSTGGSARSPSKEEFNKVWDSLQAVKKQLAGPLEGISVAEKAKLEKKATELSEEVKYLFTAGDNPEKAYRLLAGEAEARMVEARVGMTKAERQAKPPWESYDEAWGDLFKRRGGESVTAEQNVGLKGKVVKDTAADSTLLKRQQEIKKQLLEAGISPRSKVIRKIDKEIKHLNDIGK